MVEVGKKYRWKHWKVSWVEVKFIAGGKFAGVNSDGKACSHDVDDDWIEIKQRPKTLEDCRKEGDFEPKTVILNTDDNVICRKSSPDSEMAYEVKSNGENGIIQSYCQNYTLWPIQMIDE